MKEKLAIARKLRISSKSFSKNSEHRKMFSKCYKIYVVECILKGKDNFQITFGGKYINNLPARIKDWLNYLLDNVYRFYLVHVTPKDDKTFRKYELIHYGVSKPVHLKVANTPNEWQLECFLKKNGFKIVNEHLYSEFSIYNIARI